MSEDSGLFENFLICYYETVKIIVQGTKLEINEALREWVDKKIGALAKFHPDLEREDEIPAKGRRKKVDVRVELEKTRPGQRKGRIFRAEAQFNLGSKLFRAESLKGDLRQAVVEVGEDLERQLKKYKGKQRDKLERGARKAKREL